MVGYWLLVLHVLGDYVLQSDWMANKKAEQWWPAIAHVVTYTAPFALMMPRWEPLLLIGATHLVIDHYRLAKYVCWAKNFLSPKETITFIPDPNGKWHETPSMCTWDPETGEPLCEHPKFRQEVTVWRYPWAECQPTGYHKDRPMWLTMWLMFIADNAMHLGFNGLAWYLWGAA